MFYRFTKSGARVAVDLAGAYDGETVFILGGSPKLRDAIEDLSRPGVVTLAMNNVPTVFPRPTLWIGADKPACFAPSIYHDPAIQKFTIISRSNETVGVDEPTRRLVRECPNVLFFGTREDVRVRDFLAPTRHLAWWSSVFPLALQLAWKLGFRRAVLVGCDFSMPRHDQYAWPTALTGSQRDYSQRTYDADVGRLSALAPHFRRHGYEVVSATPGSRANEVLDVVRLRDEVRRAVEGRDPSTADTMKLAHSSELAPGARGEAPDIDLYQMAALDVEGIRLRGIIG